MNVQDWSDFWWNNVTGANLVVSNVVDALLNNFTVVLDVPSDLPWRRQMRSIIEDDFRSRSGSSEMIIEVIDDADECSAEQAIGMFLLQRFAQNREVRCSYRERSQRTIQDYLKEKSVLKNRVVWVKGLLEGRAARWVDFCRDYSHDSPESGLFVLEVHDRCVRVDSKNFQIIHFPECVSSYDVQLFSSFVAEKIPHLSSDWKKYISSVAANLCGTDAEIAERLLNRIDVKKDDIADVIAGMSNEEQYKMRGADPASKHIFGYSRKGDTKGLERRLWKAQIQTLFPLIEIERISIIELYKYELQEALDENHIEQYSHQVKDPIELELGTLSYMVSQYSVIREKDTQNRVKFLHNCRNKLAHIHCCSPDEVRQLLDCAL